jgi:hypothetical protein
MNDCSECWHTCLNAAMLHHQTITCKNSVCNDGNNQLQERSLVPPIRISESLNKLSYMVALSEFLLLWEQIPIDMPDCAAKHIKYFLALLSKTQFHLLFLLSTYCTLYSYVQHWYCPVKFFYQSTTHLPGTVTLEIFGTIHGGNCCWLNILYRNQLNTHLFCNTPQSHCYFQGVPVPDCQSHIQHAFSSIMQHRLLQFNTI